MIATKSQLEFSLNPSKTIFLFRLAILITVAVILAALPILSSARALAFVMVLTLSFQWVKEWSQAKPEYLSYQQTVGQWWLNGSVQLWLEPSQFVTRSLVIVYFKTANGRRLSKVIPRDAMPAEQHRLLRELLMGSGWANRDEQ